MIDIDILFLTVFLRIVEQEEKLTIFLSFWVILDISSFLCEKKIIFLSILPPPPPSGGGWSLGRRGETHPGFGAVHPGFGAITQFSLVVGLFFLGHLDKCPLGPGLFHL